MFLGWYAYAFAAEPFIVSAVATYVPLLLEGLARDNAVLAKDHRTPCHEAVNQPGLLPTPIAPLKCVVRLGYLWIDTASLPLYTFSVSVFVQTILVISISGIADRGAHRKTLLVGFAVLGALVTILLAYTGKSQYYLAALLAVIANASFGAVSVCGNAFLPQLVASECRRLVWLRRTAFDRFHGAFPEDSLREPIDDDAESASRLVPLDEKARISSRISGRGTALGYTAALLVQVMTMLILVLASGSANSKLRIVIGFIGWWWLLGQIPVALYLPATYESEEPAGAARPAGAHANPHSGAQDAAHGDESTFALDGPQQLSLWAQISFGWVSLYKTGRRARKLQDVSIFLLGWFLLSDAVTTINSTAVLFARTNLQMATPALALIGLITVVFAILGSLLFGRRRSQSSSLVLIALLAAVIPLYGIAGFFQPWIGLKHAWELFMLAAWYGVSLGALSAITRSLYSLLIPKGHEVMFFALYAVTDKGSSIIGPTITGMITDSTHNIRYTFYFLLGMMLLAAFVFAQVDYERGQIDAVREDPQIEPFEAYTDE